MLPKTDVVLASLIVLHVRSFSQSGVCEGFIQGISYPLLSLCRSSRLTSYSTAKILVHTSVGDTTRMLDFLVPAEYLVNQLRSYSFFLSILWSITSSTWSIFTWGILNIFLEFALSGQDVHRSGCPAVMFPTIWLTLQAFSMVLWVKLVQEWF